MSSSRFHFYFLFCSRLQKPFSFGRNRFMIHLVFLHVFQPQVETTLTPSLSLSPTPQPPTTATQIHPPCPKNRPLPSPPLSHPPAATIAPSHSPSAISFAAGIPPSRLGQNRSRRSPKQNRTGLRAKWWLWRPPYCSCSSINNNQTAFLTCISAGAAEDGHVCGGTISISCNGCDHQWCAVLWLCKCVFGCIILELERATTSFVITWQVGKRKLRDANNFLHLETECIFDLWKVGAVLLRFFGAIRRFVADVEGESLP